MFLGLRSVVVDVVATVAAHHVVAQNDRRFRFAVVSAVCRPER